MISIKVPTSIVAFFVFAGSSRCAPPSSVEMALHSAMAWYYRWIEPIDGDIDRIDCAVALFKERSFAYCEPVGLAIDVDVLDSRLFRASNIVHEAGGFEQSLSDFLANRNPDSQSPEAIHRFSIRRSSLTACKVDWVRTRAAPLQVMNQQQRANFVREKFTFRYPIICENDPFYLLYFIKDDKIEWIWRYDLYRDHLDPSWSFDSGSQQRKLPQLAIDNLKRKELWYNSSDQRMPHE